MKTIGIIGGGQLGKMMILEGKKLGLSFIILDPTTNCPAASIADEHIVGDFYNEMSLKELAEKSDIITYEFEHIDAQILINLQEEGYVIHPSPNSLKIIQNKFLQKNFLKNNNIKTSRFRAIHCVGDIDIAIKAYGFPVMLKNCTNGYDGKGNYRIEKQNDIPIAYKALGGDNYQLMVEEYIPFEREISVIAAMGVTGEQTIYPVGENIHQDSILKTTIVPAKVSLNVERKAKEIASKVMEIFNSQGIFCIEMFVDKEENVLVNEIAPRPHNSGHYTIEGCSTSQFYQHLRSILGLPLGEVELIKPAVMINLLGEEGYKGSARLIGVEEALKIPEVHVHFYGKEMTAPKRKMGHVTILAKSIDLALEKAEKIRKMMKVIS